MERGVTHDPEFEAWANKVWNFGNAQAPADQREKEVSLKDFRRNLTIDVFNEAGQKVISYKVYRAWVSEFTAQADLDANANAILIQSIKIEHEGWERDLEREGADASRSSKTSGRDVRAAASPVAACGRVRAASGASGPTSRCASSRCGRSAARTRRSCSTARTTSLPSERATALLARCLGRSPDADDLAARA